MKQGKFRKQDGKPDMVSTATLYPT
jgi:hypothetical protein